MQPNAEVKPAIPVYTPKRSCTQTGKPEWQPTHKVGRLKPAHQFPRRFESGELENSSAAVRIALSMAFWHVPEDFGSGWLVPVVSPAASVSESSFKMKFSQKNLSFHNIFWTPIEMEPILLER
jgi:hypothetical protein